MGADIVNIVDGKFSGRSFIHLPYGDWADLRAEIVRLRGELEVESESARHWFKVSMKHGATAQQTALAPAEAKDPAPAMPNGVEGLAGARDTLIVAANNPVSHGGVDGLRRIMLEQARRIGEALRAADNRDAAGVDHAPGFTFGVGGIAVSTGKYRKEPAVFLRGVPERGVVGKPVEGTDLKAVMVFPTVEQMQRVADALVNAPTPAAVPAGEAVAVYEGNPCVECGEDTGTGHFPGCCLGTTPQPAVGEAVAAYQLADGEGGRQWQDTDKATFDWWQGRGRPTRIVYTTPPAPVQAAPQEGEVQVEAEPDLDANDPASGEQVAQWLHRNGLRKLAFIVRTQLDIRAAHPSACELGAVREVVEAVVWRWRGVASTSPRPLIRETYSNFADELEAALQHRGDSQEVGRG